MAVDGLAMKMTKFFEKEFERRDEGLDQLNKIFGARQGTSIPQISASSVMSDGHNMEDGTTSIVV